MTMKTTTGNRLKEFMALHSLKQADIVAAAQPYCASYGVKLNRSDLSQYISGKTEPRQEKLLLLSEALNVDVAWLMGYDVPLHPLAQPQAAVVGFDLRDAEREGLFRLTDEEQALLAAFRGAEELWRGVAMELLTSHAKKEK